MQKVYNSLNQAPHVYWYKLLLGNMARPKALFIPWLACHERLATKNRLLKLGMNANNECIFYRQEETLSHVLFECVELKFIWNAILQWLNLVHNPANWQQELDWCVNHGKKKGWRATLLRIAFVEFVYGIWTSRNTISFGSKVDRNHIIQEIKNKIVYRG